jgi:tRNA1(Val) A37 N6-methylase TrmN6
MTETAVTLDAFLGGRLAVVQPAQGYRAGLDAVLVAAAIPTVATGAALRVLDVGAGVGVVGLCVAARIVTAHVVLLEVQPALAALATANIQRNRLDQRAQVIAGDVHHSPDLLRDLGLRPDTFDHVVCNPPFDIEGQGRSPPNAMKARSHVMPAGALEQWGRVLARYCRPHGTATMIHRADALGAVLAALDGRFGAIRVLPIYPRLGAPASRIIVQGTKGSRAPLLIRPGLVLHQPDGHSFTEPVQAILRDGEGLTI